MRLFGYVDIGIVHKGRSLYHLYIVHVSSLELYCNWGIKEKKKKNLRMLLGT